MAKRRNNYDRVRFLALFKYISWIYNNVTLCKTFQRNMLSRLNTLLHGALQFIIQLQAGLVIFEIIILNIYYENEKIIKKVFLNQLKSTS